MGIFDKIRTALQTEKQRLQEIREAIDATVRERERVIHAPASRADLKAMLRRWMEGQRAAYLADLKESLRPLVRSPRSLAADAPRQQQSFSLTGVSVGLGSDKAAGAAQVDRLMAFLFAETALPALERAIDQMELPGEGLPLAERDAVAVRLDEKLTALQAEEASLVAAFEEAGIPV